MSFDEGERKRVVSRRHRRMRREHRCLTDALQRGLKCRPFLDAIADALQDDERRMTLVQMPRRRPNAQGLERAYAANPEDDLLLDARFTIAAVETGGEL